MTEVISVRFRGGCKNYYFDPCGHQVKMGDQVIVETAQGPEFATCTEGNHEVEDSAIVKTLSPMLRLATDSDRRTVEQNKKRESEAFDICEKKIAAHGLEMKLVNVSASFDGSKIVFYFTADGRVDFRELVRDLAGVFRARIELRQIGVRDEAKMIGGLGICGRPLCCGSFLNEFQPVSIKMAKTQNLSLNPSKISGTCGRLMCCLKYEQEAYEDAVKRMPKNDSFVETPDGVGDVCQVNLLRETVKVRLDDAPEAPKCYRNCEVCVVRNGKGKRPEDYTPPPPEELAKLRWVDPEEEARRRRPSRERSALEEALERVLQAAEEEAEPVREKKNAEHNRSRSGSARRRKPAGEQQAAPAREPKEEKKAPQPRQKPVKKSAPAQRKPRPEDKEPGPQAAAPRAESPQQGDKPQGAKKTGRGGRYHRRRPSGGKPRGEQQPPKTE